MRVKLIAHTVIMEDIPDYVDHDVTDHDVTDHLTYADDLAEQAGRLCYLSWNRPNPETATNEGYMRNIIEKGHFSVMEHASATFFIDGVTRNFTHELIRHRHFSYSEVSQRYVDANKLEFVEHPGLADLGRPEHSYLMESVKMGFGSYEASVDNLTEKGKSRKNARQAARHSLPSGTETKILMTGNMRAWRDMLWKRLAIDENGEPLADLEFYEVAKIMLVELKRIAPNTFQDFK